MIKVVVQPFVSRVSIEKLKTGARWMRLAFVFLFPFHWLQLTSETIERLNPFLPTQPPSKPTLGLFERIFQQRRLFISMTTDSVKDKETPTLDRVVRGK